MGFVTHTGALAHLRLRLRWLVIGLVCVLGPLVVAVVLFPPDHEGEAARVAVEAPPPHAHAPSARSDDATGFWGERTANTNWCEVRHCCMCGGRTWACAMCTRKPC